MSFHGSFTHGVTLSSNHHVGILSWQACHSIHVSMSEIGGSSRLVLCASLRVWLHLGFSESHPPLRWRSARGRLSSTSESHTEADSDYKPHHNSCFDFCLFSGYGSCCGFQNRFMVNLSFPSLNLLISPQSTSAVSNAL